MFKLDKFLTITILTVILLLIFSSYSFAAEIKSEGSIVVNGEGIINADADMCEISISVVTTGEFEDKVVKENALKMNKVIGELNAMGYEDKDMETTSVYISPIYDYSGDVRKLKGFEARNTISLSVDNLDKVGQVINRSLKAGATSIGNLNFGLSESEGRYNEALRLAVKDAQKKAENISAVIDRPIKSILKIEETSSNNNLRSIQRGMMAEESMDETPIKLQKITVRASVQIEFGY